MKTPHSCKRDEWKGVTPEPVDPELNGKKVAIVGYSARALNYTAKVAGLRTYVWDCFADMDLRRSADAFVHINLDTLRNQEGKLEETAAFYLNQEVQTYIDIIEDMDYLLLGSSFENDFNAWKESSGISNYVGNQPNLAQNVRDPHRLYPFLIENSILFPKTMVIQPNQEKVQYQYYHPNSYEKVAPTNNHLDEIFTSIENTLQCPFVMKSANSGGGLGIFLVKDKANFVDKYELLTSFRQPPFICQEYISGTPMSTSFLANGKDAKIHTISHQIIGDHRFGCKGQFTYCGNVMNETISDPNHEKNEKITSKLNGISQKMTQFGELRGSNGIDFVKVESDEGLKLYFMELNPRFQGTIDLVLACTGENIVQKHIQSCDKAILPEDVCFPDEKTYLKIIYYSPLDFHIMVDLQGLEFRDVPLIGSFISAGSPICSNIVIGDSVGDAYEKALDDRDLMTRVMGWKSRIPETEEFVRR